MNRDYAIVARENNYTIDRIKGDNLAEFPIEKARLRSVWYLLVVVVLAIAGYGWSIFARAVCPAKHSEKAALSDHTIIARCYPFSHAILDRGHNDNDFQHLRHPCRRP